MYVAEAFHFFCLSIKLCYVFVEYSEERDLLRDITQWQNFLLTVMNFCIL